MEAQPGDLGEALVQVADAADLTCQANLADGGQVAAKRPVQIAGGRGQHGRQVRRRFIQAQAAYHVDIGITVAHGDAAPLFQHGQQHGGPVVVDAVGAAGRVIPGGADQSLDLRQQRTAALHDRGHAGAGAVLRASGEQQLRGIGHAAQPLLIHLKHADLVGGAKTVLGGPQDAEACALLALKIEHAVHHVLQHLGPGDTALLGDMAHHEHGGAALLGKAHEPQGTLPHLADAAGGGIHLHACHSLDGIQDQDLGRKLLHGGQDAFQLRFRQDIQFLVFHVQALGAQLELPLALLSGHIEYPPARLQLGAHLQQQRGLADARGAAHQIQ